MHTLMFYVGVLETMYGSTETMDSMSSALWDAQVGTLIKYMVFSLSTIRVEPRVRELRILVQETRDPGLI